MATKLKLDMTILQGQKPLAARAPIRYIERGATRHDVDSPVSPNAASIDEFHRALFNGGAKLKIKIEWIPDNGSRSLFNSLKGAKNVSDLEITINWFVRDTDSNSNLVTKRGTFYGVTVTSALGSNIQVVEFTSKNFLPDWGIVHEAKHARV